MDNEQWKDIEGYEGIYQVSNRGRVKSIKRWRASGTGGYVQRETILVMSGKRYQMVTLYSNKIGRGVLVHRLVACAFVPNNKNFKQVNHKDGNKKHNTAENLEWCTAKENIRQAIALGIGTVGERNGMAKFSNNEIRELRKSYIPYDEKFGASALARRHNVSVKTMWSILTRKTYKSIT